MKYLVSSTEVYRVDSEEEAKALIEETKEKTIGVLSKYGCVHKERKQKNEIVDEWYQVTLCQKFNDEKEPDSEISLTYGRS